MFLHSGVSLHEHEFSQKKPPPLPGQPAARGSLLKTALRPLSTPSDYTREADGIVQSCCSRLLSSRIASTDETHHRPSFVLVQRAASNSAARKDLAVRFREPGMEQIQTPSASEDDESIAGSEITDGTTDTSIRRKHHRRMSRKSARFALAQPAPQLRTKQRHLVQIRPRLLLQLQEIGDRRAIPAFDLIPSHLVAGTLIIPKLAKRFPRIFHANAELSQNDVLIVRSDDYSSTSTTSSLPTSGGGRRTHPEKDICGVISALPRDCGPMAEIVMEDGSSWSASAMENGSFEFINIDDDGEMTTARWVQRSNLTTRNSLGSIEPSNTVKSGLQDPPPQDSRWTFSIIDPSSRRHPIMGSLTPETLEVYDNYTTLSTSSGRFPPSRSLGPEVGVQSAPGGLSSEPRITLAVRPDQKALMIATASWIRLHQQGWPASSNPKFAMAIPSSRRCANASPSCAIRRQTFPLYEGSSRVSARPDSPDSIHGFPWKHHSQGGMPVRALSTGRAFMKRRKKQLEGLATVYSNQELSPPSEKEQLDRRETDKTGCLSRMRHWTNRIFQRKKDLPP